ncbi:hypothetical protein PQR37_37520 [Paraburkholderia nemoris]|uniref:hypothetical protein n=1 Tax=Paraburkholderia nemoris TaxID=2793076 RepID=UPI0038B71CC5
MEGKFQYSFPVSTRSVERDKVVTAREGCTTDPFRRYQLQLGFIGVVFLKGPHCTRSNIR